MNNEISPIFLIKKIIRERWISASILGVFLILFTIILGRMYYKINQTYDLLDEKYTFDSTDLSDNCEDMEEQLVEFFTRENYCNRDRDCVFSQGFNRKNMDDYYAINKRSKIDWNSIANKFYANQCEYYLLWPRARMRDFSIKCVEKKCEINKKNDEATDEIIKEEASSEIN